MVEALSASRCPGPPGWAAALSVPTRWETRCHGCVQILVLRRLKCHIRPPARNYYPQPSDKCSMHLSWITTTCSIAAQIERVVTTRRSPKTSPQQCIIKLYEGVERGHPQTIDKTTVGYAIRTLRSVVNDYFRKDIRERSAHERAETSMAGRSADDPGNRVADRDQVLWFLQSGS